MRKKVIKGLEIFEMLIWRRMQKINLTEHIHVGLTSKEALAIIGEEGALIQTIRKRRRKWI